MFHTACQSRRTGKPESPLPLHLRYFTSEELVVFFVDATPETECLGDLRQAGQEEMTYTFEQGINSRSLIPQEACMTMKQLWLFSCGLGWSEEKRIEYWRRNIKLAVGTGAGLFVHEVFDGDNELAGEAFKWMMQFDHNQDFTPSHFFMVPRYTNHPSSSDEGVEDIESVGDGGVGVEDEEEGREQEEERGPSRVEERLVTNGAESLSSLVARMAGLTTPWDVLSELRAFRPQLHISIPPPPPLEFDVDVLVECIDILRSRSAANLYKAKLETSLRKKVDILPENDDIEEEGDDEEGEPKPVDDEVSVINMF